MHLAGFRVDRREFADDGLEDVLCLGRFNVTLEVLQDVH